ncbi:Rv3235 family protein [Dactylosporangium sp. CA-233914]|uniref:Rv3235 family protein n=1 Tax=Dactylosporangium sp. CA-233914 TaxID=3239934 RepID=UPI003D8CEDC2
MRRALTGAAVAAGSGPCPTAHTEPSQPDFGRASRRAGRAALVLVTPARSTGRAKPTLSVKAEAAPADDSGPRPGVETRPPLADDVGPESALKEDPARALRAMPTLAPKTRPEPAVKAKPQRGAGASAGPAVVTRSGPGVVLRMPPALDPPPNDPRSAAPPESAGAPSAGMDPLPLEWPGTLPMFQPPPPPRQPQPAPPPPRERSNAYPAAQRFVGLCVEILNGYRPPGQLRPMTHPQRFADISDQILRRTVRVRMNPSQAARQGTLVRARRLLLSEPLDGIAEGVVVLEHGDSTWAMAIRLEKSNRPGFGVLGWMCTVVQVV